MDLTALRSDVSGTVLTSDDETFVASLLGLPGGSPAAVVNARSEADVAAAVRFAADEGLGVAVRSGGHSGGVFSPGPDRLLVDLRELNSVTVHDDGTVDVGPGAVWGDVAAQLQKHGLAISSGDHAAVGVGGLTLGGGIGWLVRRDGLALDSLIGARVVLASGDVVSASADEEPELFWALTGGGGNFGVVTSFRFRAHALGAVLGVTLQLDPAHLAETLRGWREAMREAPDELSATFAVIPNGPPGPEFALLHQIVACWAGDDSDVARAAIAPLLALPGVIESEVRRTDYRALLAELPEGNGGPIPAIAARTALFPDFGDAGIDALLDVHSRLGLSVFTIRYLGGAFGRVDPTATAFAHRDAEVVASIVEFLPPGTPASAAGITAAWTAVAPFSMGVYGNFTTETGPEVIAAMYPAPTLERLRSAKTRYDPRNQFSNNLNVAPR